MNKFIKIEQVYFSQIKKAYVSMDQILYLSLVCITGAAYSPNTLDVVSIFSSQSGEAYPIMVTKEFFDKNVLPFLDIME